MCSDAISAIEQVEPSWQLIPCRAATDRAAEDRAQRTALQTATAPGLSPCGAMPPVPAMTADLCRPGSQGSVSGAPNRSSPLKQIRSQFLGTFAKWSCSLGHRIIGWAVSRAQFWVAEHQTIHWWLQTKTCSHLRPPNMHQMHLRLPSRCRPTPPMRLKKNMVTEQSSLTYDTTDFGLKLGQCLPQAATSKVQLFQPACCCTSGKIFEI